MVYRLSVARERATLFSHNLKVRYPAAAFPSSAPFGGAFPQGKAFRRTSPNNHQGSALQARKQGNSDPLAGSAAPSIDKNGTDFPK